MDHRERKILLSDKAEGGVSATRSRDGRKGVKALLRQLLAPQKPCWMYISRPLRTERMAATSVKCPIQICLPSTNWESVSMAANWTSLWNICSVKGTVSARRTLSLVTAQVTVLAEVLMQCNVERKEEGEQRREEKKKFLDKLFFFFFVSHPITDERKSC